MISRGQKEYHDLKKLKQKLKCFLGFHILTTSPTWAQAHNLYYYPPVICVYCGKEPKRNEDKG